MQVVEGFYLLDFAVVIAARQVFAPAWLSLREDAAGNGLFWIVPLILSLLLMLKALPRTSVLGNGAMAALMAIGAGVAFVGAVAGTLLPQILLRYDKHRIMGTFLRNDIPERHCSSCSLSG